MRDWIHVDDHSSAVRDILTRGKIGESYLISASEERSNLEVMRMILRVMGESEDAFDWVPDRPGHDLRYASDASKLRDELGWRPLRDDFEAELRSVVAWYCENVESWIDAV